MADCFCFPGHRYHLLVAKPEFFEQVNRRGIVFVRHCDNAPQTEFVATLCQHCKGRFAGIALPPVRMEKCKSQVRIRESFPADQATNAGGDILLAHADPVKTKAMMLVLPERNIAKILQRIVFRVNTLVADEPLEGRLIQQIEDEIDIVERQLRQRQSLGAQHGGPLQVLDAEVLQRFVRERIERQKLNLATIISAHRLTLHFA